MDMDCLLLLFLLSYTCIIVIMTKAHELFVSFLPSTVLGYSPAVTMHLYRDMSARDLVQRRVTAPNGDTLWEMTALVKVRLLSVCTVVNVWM